MAGLGEVAEAGGDAAFNPTQAEMVQGATLSGGEVAESREEIGGLGIAAHLGKVVDEVVVDAEDEAGIALGIDQALGSPEGLDGGLRVSHFDMHRGLGNEASAGEVRIPVLGLTAEEKIHGLIEELEGFGEAALGHSKRSLQGQEDRLIAEGVSYAGGAGLPPGVCHLEASLGSDEIALHFVGVGESRPGEGSKLIDPLLLEGLSLGNQVRDVDGQVGEVGGLGGVFRCGLAALVDEELAESPAHKAWSDVEMGKAVLGVEGGELFQELGRFSTGPSQDGVDQAEDGREGVGPVQIEKPAAHLSTGRTHRQSVEELLVLLG
jgi:hypothetical protein